MIGALLTRVGVDDARLLAQTLLSPERLQHTRGVAARAADLVGTIGTDQDEVLISAAWLHDIGYSDLAQDTGFHPLDGARLLDRLGWPARISALVAHHSGASFVAGPLGLSGPLGRYPDEFSPMSDALTYADQTTGPAGQSLPIGLRMAGMLTRHGPASVNTVVHHLRGPHLLRVADRVRRRLETLEAPLRSR